MRDKLFFAQKNLEDFGAFILRQSIDTAPAKVYTDIEVPGRHGKLLQNEHRLSNVNLTYWLLFLSDGWNNFVNLKNWLLSFDGYQRIEDTFDPDFYRMGVYRGSTEPIMTRRRDWCKCTVTFDCLPQRWHKDGDAFRAVQSDSTLNNPFLTDAKPLIRVRGTGSLTVNGHVIYVDNMPTAGYIDFDSEKEDCYAGNENCNNKVQFSVSHNEFPVFHPGENTIAYSGLTSVEIAPRWWSA